MTTSPRADHSESGGRAATPRSRFPTASVALAIGLVVVVGLGGWFWWDARRRHRPGIVPGERYGIDVSAHQGTIDWKAVAGDDLAFAYIKATEGGDFVDEQFAGNWRGAVDAGLKRGAYHYFTLCRPGVDQAENFLRVVPREADALPPVVDLEFQGNCPARPTRDSLLQELGDFVGKVESVTGKQLVFYVIDDFDAAYGVRQAITRLQWRRNIGHRPATNDWLLWQAADKAAVAGIAGEVDLNVGRAGLSLLLRAK